MITIKQACELNRIQNMLANVCESIGTESVTFYNNGDILFSERDGTNLLLKYEALQLRAKGPG